MSEIKIMVGDITTLECDAIVNAANKTLLGGGGVDGAIHRAAGKELLAECRTLGGCNTGEAKITAGYKLPAKHVIHTVGPIYSGKKSDSENLASCYRNSLNLLKSNGLHSVAFSCISTGVYGYPHEDAARIAWRTVNDWINSNKGYNVTVIFCCFGNNNYKLYKALEKQ